MDVKDWLSQSCPLSLLFPLQLHKCACAGLCAGFGSDQQHTADS